MQRCINILSALFSLRSLKPSFQLSLMEMPYQLQLGFSWWSSVHQHCPFRDHPASMPPLCPTTPLQMQLYPSYRLANFLSCFVTNSSFSLFPTHFRFLFHVPCFFLTRLEFSSRTRDAEPRNFLRFHVGYLT